MEIQERRPIAPNVKIVSKRVLHQFVTWLRTGIGLGLMLFVALTTFSTLTHGANWIEGLAKQSQLRARGQGRSLVLPIMAYAAPVRVVRSAVMVQKSQDDYRMFHEQANLACDLLRIAREANIFNIRR